MKIRTEQLTGKAATPISMIGLSFPTIEAALAATKNLLREVIMSMKLDCAFSLLPAARPKELVPLFTIHGLSFGAWDESQAKNLVDPLTEEAVFLLYAKGTTPDTRRFYSPKFSSYPYAWMKTAGDDGKSITLLFNPGHLDVALYFPTSLEVVVGPALKKVGIVVTNSAPSMEKYSDHGGDSNVSRYEIGLDYLKVEFGDGGVYLYDYAKPGRESVEHMKKLAAAGQGLNSFINTNVRKNYSKKLQ
ncbi:hypothetical protein BH10BDE1_BH10BDE1_23770 [soil metagenome]